MGYPKNDFDPIDPESVRAPNSFIKGHWLLALTISYAIERSSHIVSRTPWVVLEKEKEMAERKKEVVDRKKK